MVNVKFRCVAKYPMLIFKDYVRFNVREILGEGKKC